MPTEPDQQSEDRPVGGKRNRTKDLSVKINGPNAYMLINLAVGSIAGRAHCGNAFETALGLVLAIIPVAPLTIMNPLPWAPNHIGTDVVCIRQRSIVGEDLIGTRH